MHHSMARATRHGAAAIVEAALVALIAMALVIALAIATGHNPAGASAVHAAPSTASWIELSSVGARTATSSITPHLGDYVTFDTSYPKTVKNPRILVNCYQGGDLVFGMGGSVTYEFLLGGGGSTWLTAGGAADCEALLFYYGKEAGKQVFNVLPRTTFDAGS